jgi:hypothetical protein
MCGQDQLIKVRQDDLPRAVAQNHLAADAAPDRRANRPYAGLTDHGRAQGQEGKQMTGTNAAAMRAGIKRTPRQHSRRRLGLRLWTLLHAQVLLNGPGSGAQVIAFIEDDYRRLRTPVRS